MDYLRIITDLRSEELMKITGEKRIEETGQWCLSSFKIEFRCPTMETLNILVFRVFTKNPLLTKLFLD